VNIGVITSGGDSPGMNPCIARIVTVAVENGHRVFGFRRAFRGILEQDAVELRPIDVEGWYKLGGTALKTSRLPELVEKAVQQRVLEQLHENAIDALIVIGGDGSFRAAMDLCALDGRVNIIGIPGTIDNNIYGSQYTLGHDTALNKLAAYIDDISDTAMSLPGRVFFVETLGAFDSYLPQSSVIMGMADFSVLYEPRTSNEEIAEKVSAFRDKKNRDYVLATFAEGAAQMFPAAEYVREKLKLNVKCNLIGFQQRGGTPSALDRMRAAGFARYALEAIEKGIRGQYVVYNNGAYGYRDLGDAKLKKTFDNYGFT
jgi:6-phosphofructokinase 1